MEQDFSNVGILSKASHHLIGVLGHDQEVEVADGVLAASIAPGGFLVVANVAPEKCKEMIQSFEDGDVARARQLHYELLPLCKACFVPGEVNPIGAKTILAEMGKIGSEMRLPLSPMSGKNLEVLRALMKEGGLT